MATSQNVHENVLRKWIREAEAVIKGPYNGLLRHYEQCAALALVVRRTFGFQVGYVMAAKDAAAAKTGQSAPGPEAVFQQSAAASVRVGWLRNPSLTSRPRMNNLHSFDT